ncbi:hypothetical protein [Intestinimonas butyriciproducens]|uniref:hypothetical protein n=1 Tax=Intestinimonas butyriciproducens TaxID=1297617 RepID=UPI00189A8884|nr:hypothetical protein [Intestinimonas butyriciproducens]MDB7829119.1 hypothetical protein [Intestinimonas butyriciproducens]
MSVWGAYEARLSGSGDNPKRDSELSHIQSRMRRKITASLSYKSVKIDGKAGNLAIVDDNDFDTKKIYSMPGEDIPHGGLVEWSDSIWLITERNAHTEFCTEGKMRQCNYVLKWIDECGNVISKWCVVEDGTKYLTGERAEDMMTIGDARISITIGKDPDTDKLSRGRRFLIDDIDSKDVLAYQITKPNKLYNVYNGRGVFRFILTEDNLTDNDNPELRIADYYGWKPVVERPKPDTKVDSTLEDIVTSAIEKKENLPGDIDERKVWL